MTATFAIDGLNHLDLVVSARHAQTYFFKHLKHSCSTLIYLEPLAGFKHEVGQRLWSTQGMLSSILLRTSSFWFNFGLFRTFMTFGKAAQIIQVSRLAIV